MGLLAVNKRILAQSTTLPGIVMQQQQQSGYFRILGGGNPKVILGEQDLMVYANYMEIATQSLVSQNTVNNLPSVDIKLSFAGTAVYNIQAQAIWSGKDVAIASNWNASLPYAQRKGMHQGMWQQLRVNGLYGANPEEGEGILKYYRGNCHTVDSARSVYE